MKNSENSLPKGAGKSSFSLVQKDVLIDLLPVEKGQMVLDLACGQGFYSIVLSQMAGEEGRIYALDLWEEGIGLLNRQIREENIRNITTLHADGAALTENGLKDLDVCFMATVLHDFEEAGRAMEVLEQVRQVLKPGGRLCVLEFKKIDGPPGPPVKIRLSEDQVEKMAVEKGFAKVLSADVGDYHYLMVFELVS